MPRKENECGECGRRFHTEQARRDHERRHEDEPFVPRYGEMGRLPYNAMLRLQS